MPQVIAYPGTAGSFSHAAVQSAFPGAECVGYTTFPEAAQSVVAGQADYALLPVENSFAGAVLPTYTLLEKLPLNIVGETMKAVRHNLLAVPGATIEDIRQIASHPQAIAQCDEFLQMLPGVQIIPSANTAISAREVAQRGDPSYAAIASTEAAREYGLAILAENIQTSSQNTTRFFILSRYALPLAAPSKATVVFTVNNEVGALVRVLSSFAESGLNMSRIESRPLPETTFQYFFSADFEGEMDAAHLNRAMEAARPYTCELRLLGVYPKAVRPD
ncbi:MAG: prephenate dehydratase [Clostridia bacterium]|nr:prephenate dehydratase [Clostridia bacterium]